MRCLALAIMVVSAFSLADVTFGFQETDKPKDKKAAAANVRKADPGQPAPAVTARGYIECPSVCDVRCEVSSTDAAGVSIREIVPEGTLVKKGQVLVELDAAGLEEQVVRQQMACHVSEAGVIKSTNEYDVAVIEKEAFVEGTFKIAKLEAEFAIFVLKEALRRAERELPLIEGSTETGQTPKRELDATKFAVAKAQRELHLAETRLLVLQKYTYVKTLKQLEGQIKTAEARLKAEQHSNRLGLERLERINSHVANCTVRAPMAGRVVYAEPRPARVRTTDRRADETPRLYQPYAKPTIGPRARLHKGQPILSIGDPGKMQIKVSIPGSDPAPIKRGAAATIRVDAFPDMELKGTVAKIAKPPAGPPSRSRGQSTHQATISIQDPPEDLRAGLTAEVTIHAGQRQ